MKNKKSLNESFEILNELMRNLQKQLYLYDGDKGDIKWLLNKKLRNRLYGDKPKCFIPLKSNYGEDVPFFCLCNRSGSLDPHIMKKSIQMVNHMIKHNKYDPEQLNNIKRKLNHFYHRYNKDIPKPHSSTSHKIKYNRKMNNLKNYLNKINGE